ncbi:MAG: cell cycle transcriptional regulator TrcR [Pseudomonadota bacterium]
MTLTPLMPKATAVWLVDNTALTFEQIAEFCGLHVLEVKGIADGDVASGIKGMDPISSGQLTRDEIKRGQADSGYRLKMAKSKVEIPKIKTKKKPKYTPVSRRQDRPNAILWLLRHHTDLKDAQVIRLVGTTKPTIQSIRERTHWNSSSLQPMDPVTLGLCSQMDLDREVQRAAERAEKERQADPTQDEKAGTLLPTAETIVDTKAVNARDIRDNLADLEKSADEIDTADVFSDDDYKDRKSDTEDDAPDVHEVFAKLDQEKAE